MIEVKKSIAGVIRANAPEPSRIGKQRLDRCERTAPFTEKFLADFRAGITGEMVMTYPEPEPLYYEFAKWLNIDKAKLLFHTGSDLSIKSIFETYIEPKDKILLHQPGYAMYTVYANIFNAQIEHFPFREDLTFNFFQYLEILNNTYKMVVIENPNGFIGCAHNLDLLYELLKKSKKMGVIAVVDEAYFHFNQESVIQYLDEFDNLFIIRTTSKALGLAGLRCGYILSQEHNIENLRKVMPMHELTSLTIHCLRTILKHQDEIDNYLASTVNNRSYLINGFKKIGIKTSDSCTNFIAAQIGDMLDPITLKNHLAEYDFLIRRPFRENHLWKWTRIGTAPINIESRLLQLIAEFMEKKS